MPTSEETRRLRELHDDYAWLVNAAVEEGREDLVWKLSDEYLVRAMQIMTDEHADDCEPVTPVLPRPPRAAGRRRAFSATWLWRILHR